MDKDFIELINEPLPALGSIINWLLVLLLVLFILILLFLLVLLFIILSFLFVKNRLDFTKFIQVSTIVLFV